VTSKDPPFAARVELPPWLWGGDPSGFLKQANLRTRKIDGDFSIQTEESYLRRKPGLLRVKALAGPTLSKPRYDDLAKLVERVEIELPDGLESLLAKYASQAETSSQPLNLLRHQMLALFGAKGLSLPVQARYFHERLQEITLAEDPAMRPFANSGLQLMEIDIALIHRLKVPSVWLRLEHDDRLNDGDSAHVRQVLNQDQAAFNSSGGLLSGVFMFDAYLSPLLAALTPGVWAVDVVRSFGNLVITFGNVVSGTAGGAAEMLQLIAVQGAEAPTPFPKLTETASMDAVRWWVERLDEVFGVMSDLAVFTNTEGWYRPAKHLEALLTVEQLFRRVTSLLVSHRDTNARWVLLFSVLDTLEPLSHINLQTMCTYSYAKKVLDRLEAGIPTTQAEVLLQAARRGVKALGDLQDGFFIRNQLGTERVELRLSDGSRRALSPDDAVARYLKVLRDATHGHGSNKPGAASLTDALLAHHDGEIPHDLGLLAVLYLIDTLTQPDRLRRALFDRGRG